MIERSELEEAQILRGKWEEEFNRLYGSLKVESRTRSGIPLKPVYTPEDVKDLPYSELGVPGVYPYARGNFPLAYQFQPWGDQQLHGYGLPEHTRQRMDFLREAEGTKWRQGMQAYSIVCDLPSSFGYDPDQPEARGRVGVCGVSVATMRDWEILWDGIDLTKIHPYFVRWEFSSLPILAMHVAYARRRGIPPEQLRGTTTGPLPSHWYLDTPHFPPRSTFKLLVQHARYCVRNMPNWVHTVLDDYEMVETGCSPLQSLAFTFATWIAIAEEYIKAGLKPDEFMHGFMLHTPVGIDFFEEIAKIRAMRRIWAKLSRERFGCQHPRSWRPRFYVNTLASDLTRQQPLNNIARATIETLAAALAGAPSIEPCPYDEVWGIPTEEAEIIAIRTGQILSHETGIQKVCDPLAGSYYVEWLTKRVEEDVMKIVREVDEKGFLECLENGWFKQQAMKFSAERQDRISKGEEVIVGVNRYISEEAEREISAFEYPPDIERVAVERVKKYKEERDNAQTRAALARLREEAERVNTGDGDLMPPLIETAEAEATIGEMMAVLREVFGWISPS